MLIVIIVVGLISINIKLAIFKKTSFQYPGYPVTKKIQYFYTYYLLQRSYLIKLQFYYFNEETPDTMKAVN